MQVSEKSVVDRIAAKIQKRIRVKSIKDTMIVNIAYSHDTPFIAQLVTNALPDAYAEELRAMREMPIIGRIWFRKIRQERFT